MTTGARASDSLASQLHMTTAMRCCRRLLSLLLVWDQSSSELRLRLIMTSEICRAKWHATRHNSTAKLRRAGEWRI